MSNQKTHERWLERVFYDLDTAKAMVQTGRLIYAIFMCQQAIEKCFKALLSYKDKEIIPIHNLRRLAELSGLIDELDEVKLMKLDFLSSYYIMPATKKICSNYRGELLIKRLKILFIFPKGSFHGFVKR